MLKDHNIQEAQQHLEDQDNRADQRIQVLPARRYDRLDQFPVHPANLHKFDCGCSNTGNGSTNGRVFGRRQNHMQLVCRSFPSQIFKRVNLWRVLLFKNRKF